jgi:hypothetical protein
MVYGAQKKIPEEVAFHPHLTLRGKSAGRGGPALPGF